MLTSCRFLLFAFVWPSVAENALFASAQPSISGDSDAVKASTDPKGAAGLAGQSGCTAKRDCMYNGDCVDGQCRCFLAFAGSRCSLLNLQPTTKTPTTGLRTVESDGSQVSSWGGSVLRGDDGLWHMWAAESTNGTGIKCWQSNHQIVHAVADSAVGPYRRQDVVFPVFSSEPTVSRAPTGEYVMYFTASEGDLVPCTGKPCFGHNGSSDETCPYDRRPHGKAPACNASVKSFTWMSFAKMPRGPWSAPQQLTGGDSNLAAVIFQNGTVLGALKRGSAMIVSPDWRNISAYKFFPRTGIPSAEDPTLWFDCVEGERVLHSVWHGPASAGWTLPFGYHFFSEDGGYTWHGDMSNTYSQRIAYSDAPAQDMCRRERPHVVLGGTDGRIAVALSTSVTETCPCFPDNCPVDYSYTHVQPLGVKAAEFII